MSNIQAQAAELQAVLTLAGDVRLAGEVSALLDGRLQLASARVVGSRAGGGKISLSLAGKPNDKIR